jgi:hypothetical protein
MEKPHTHSQSDSPSGFGARKRTKSEKPLRSFSLLRVLGYTIIILGLMLCVMVIAFRYLGLPEQVGERIGEELQQRGIRAHYDRLYLSPLGGVVASNLVITQSVGGVTRTLKVKDLRFGFNWISWWRGESFLDNARIDRADLTIPLDQDTAILLRNVTARIDFKGTTILLENLEADLLNIHCKLHGVIHLEGYTAKAGSGEPDMSRYADLWKKVEKTVMEIDSVKPLTLDIRFDVVLAEPARSELRLRLRGQGQSWHGVLVEDCTFDAEYLDERVSLTADLRFLRGGIQMEGNWKTSQKKAVLSLYSDADLSLLAGAIPGKAGEVIADIRFRALPINEVKADLDWENGFHYLLQTRSDWKDFSLLGSYFDSLYCPISYDGKRVMLTEMTVVNSSGNSTLSAFYDGDQVLKARLKSAIDPTSLKKLFGEQTRPFFNSLLFKEAPLIECSITGQGLDTSTFRLQGSVSASRFSYKEVPLQQLKTSFVFENKELHLPDLFIQREEGEGRGEIWHNIETKQVRIKGAKGRLMIREVATIIGDKMKEYAQPYGFYEAPDFQVDGQVDLDKQEKTDLKIRIRSEKGLDYVFLGKKLSLRKLDADVGIKGKELTFNPRKPLQLFEGELEGNLIVQMLADPTYVAKLKIKDQQFGPLMKTFFNNEDVSGKITGLVDVQGTFSDLKTLQGWGDFTVTKGFLYNIPMFGGFSEILNSIVPNLGYSEASQARASFTVREGLITIQKVDVYSTAFALIGNGSYDMIQDEVKMNMRVNLRGVLGIPFFLVSKLFEYEGKGTLSDTKWGPKVF